MEPIAFPRAATAWAIGSDGPKIEHLKGSNIVSDALALGAIQVPGTACPLFSWPIISRPVAIRSWHMSFAPTSAGWRNAVRGDVVRFVAISVGQARNELIATTQALREMSTAHVLDRAGPDQRTAAARSIS